MNSIYLLIPDYKAGYEPLALATVIETQGSTPQKHGSSALFNTGGLISGTVGGGVLEGKVQQIAQRVLITKESGLYHFNLDNDISFRHDAICGGQATILIDASPDDHHIVFEQIKTSIQNRIPGVLVTIIAGTEETRKKIKRYWFTSGNKNNLPEKYSNLLLEEVEELLSASNPNDFKKYEPGLKGEKNLISLSFLLHT
jgi:xanthine/CO dehydrogenase XdhC/CoxF family maturation factor